ncbi:MAG: hypothetical protein ACP5RN_02720 [Armatimonadota bacterium]
MGELTTHERVKRMYEHREADRVPITDSPWGATLERWHRESIREEANFAEFFGLDCRVVATSSVPTTPCPTA